MHLLFRIVLLSLSLLMVSGTAQASLKPGEIRLIGKLVEYDKKNKQITFYCNKRKMDLTFEFETRKGPYIFFNQKKATIRRYQSKQDEIVRETIIVYQALEDYDKNNVKMEGYVVRSLSGVDQELYDELHKREPSKR